MTHTRQEPRASDPFREFATPASYNIASLLRERAAELGDRDAVRVPGARDGMWPARSYDDLESESDAIAYGLEKHGLRTGDRACVFVPPGFDLVALTWGLYKLGAVPVLIDPGMGRRSLLDCVERVQPRAFIGVARAHAARVAFSRSFRTVELAISVGRGLRFGAKRLEDLVLRGRPPYPMFDARGDDEAAILFTSGSTGPPKGVVYTHQTFHTQVQALGRMYKFAPGEIDVACFPLFGLFDAALGMTSVFPDLDPSRPARCDPAKIAAALEQNEATTTFGSPAIWRVVAPYCTQHALRFPNLKRILMAGAPVSADLVEECHHMLPLDGDVMTPYGATEALPVATIDGREIVGSLREKIETGSGTCVGRIAPGISIALIRIDDGPIDAWTPDLEVRRGELGEICVRGPVVTREYKFDEAATELAKIQPMEGQSGVWHRMGDIGYMDSEDRLWFCGRKGHRIERTDGVLMPVPVENIYNPQKGIRRTAVVGVGPSGEQRPVLIVELDGSVPKGKQLRKQMANDVLRIGKPHAGEADIREVLFHPSLPVDVRHNAKIHRTDLAEWAARELRRRPQPAAEQATLLP